MDPEEAISLLLKSASPKDEAETLTPQNRSLARGIAAELGYLALALAQAGTTIRRRIYTLERYLNYYLGHRKTMMSYPQITGADEANIITTWEIPFRRIENRASIEHKDAVDLLHIFAFMHFESIPEKIFQRSWSAIEGLDLEDRAYPGILRPVWNEEAQARLRRAVRVLCDYSIIDHELKKRSCSLHPVVHTWARDRLNEPEQRQWLSCTMAILGLCISPNLEVSGRKFRRLLLPHLDSCIRALKLQCPLFPDSIERAAEIEKFAWVYAENGLWGVARTLQSKIIDFRTKHLGKWHEATILAQQSLGYTCWNLFEIRRAISIQTEVLKSLWWVRPTLAYWTAWPPWKPDHVPYCTALDDLTLTLWLAGKREWSKYVGERAVNGLLKRLGPEDPKTLTAMFNLARTYLHLGDHHKSHELLVWVLKKRKRLFGPDHPDTLMARNEFGMLLCARNQHLAVAERLVANVLESRKKILGEEHAYTLWSVNDLSKVLCDRGRPEEAVKMLEEIRPVVKRTLGDEHIGMSMTLSNLARAHALSEHWEKADELLGPLLRRIPSDHPDWIHNMHGYVRVRIHLGNLAAVENDCMKMLDKISKSKVLALDDPRTVAIAKELLKIYHTQGRFGEIASLRKRVPSLNEDDLLEDRFNVYTLRKGS
jgi:Tetratricopeptide repeat